MIMKNKKLLAICIPTYNRAEKLERNLSYLMKFVTKLKIPIYISNNASTDNTLDVLEKFQKLYSGIKVYTHCENIGPDKNFEYVLKMSGCHYSWLLGDDDFILFNKFNLVMDELESHKPDFLVVNSRNQVKKKLPKLYTNCDELLSDLAWHMTFISCLVFSKDAIEKASFQRYMDHGFVHVGAAFDYLSNISNMKVIWVDDCCITTLRDDDELPSWYPHLLEVFVENWANTIYSLPIHYSSGNKFKAVKSLWTESSIISIKALVILRAYGYMDGNSFKNYEERLKNLYGWKTVFIYVVSISPIWLIAPVIKMAYGHYVQKRIKESKKEMKRLLS